MNVHENIMHTLLPEFFQDSDNQFLESNFVVSSPEDIFSILEALDGVSTSDLNSLPPLDHESSLRPQESDNQQPEITGTNLVAQNSTFSFNANPLEDPSDTELEAAGNLHKAKKQKIAATGDEVAASIDGQQKISHITVERNRRKQMNENLSVLRSLMPCFYVKRGDQASIVGGVVDYITELQQVLQSLEAKKQRKAYSEVLSPRLVSSPRNLPMSPRKPPLSPRLLIPSLPISPTTPTSPYKHHGLLQSAPYNFSPTIMSPSNSSNNHHNAVAAANELVANSKSGIADVEVKFSGPNVLLKTVSARIPGQALKVILALEALSLQILHVSLSTTGDAMINSFTIKIGIECQLSAEDLALHVQQTFC